MATRERPRQRQDDEFEDDAFEDDAFEDDAFEDDAFEDESLLGYESVFDLDDDITDEDIEDFLLEQAEAEERSTKKPGFLNLQTGAGLALIAVGTIYLLQQLGFFALPFSLGGFVALLPWLAGILIILTGFGVLSWSPSRRRRKARRKARERRRQSRRQSRTTGHRRGSDAFERARKSAERAARGAGSTASRLTQRRERRRKLAKSRKHKVIAGVAGGIADYFGIDPLLVRIAFVIGAVAGSGAAFFLYIILMFVLPKADDDPDDDTLIRIVRD